MTGFTDPDSPEYQPPLEDYWDKPRTITARHLATALIDVDLTRVESRETMYLDLAAAIIAAITETAHDWRDHSSSPHTHDENDPQVIHWDIEHAD